MKREADADGHSPAASASRIVGEIISPTNLFYLFNPAMWFTGPKPLPGA